MEELISLSETVTQLLKVCTLFGGMLPFTF